ncbi:hypothetical protein [Cryobacterium cheniae]|uniref:hypothetical protein n=1 Tax=Cryobacterium cheniae TaxID=1259262 RepID=UPI00141AC776|nr:hypothetical protein [Cryobacterium cheniae]
MAASTLIGLGTSSALTIIVMITNLVYYATRVFACSIGDTEIGWTHVRNHFRISAP